MVSELTIQNRSRIRQLSNIKTSYPKAFYWLILLNVIIDVFAFWSEPGGLTAIIRVVTLYSVFFYFLLIKKIQFEKNIYILLFSAYALLQLFTFVDFDYSLKLTLQIITSLLMFFVGYAMIKNEFDFFYYLKQFFWIYVIIIINTIVSNIFKIGLDDYTKSTDYVVGGLNDLWNIYTYSLIMLPLLIFYRVQKKWILYLCSFLVMIFLLISLKRIAILGIVFAAFTYLLFLRNKANILKKLAVFFILVGITYPFFSNLFLIRIQVRAEMGRFDNDFYESEGRYLELNYLYEKVLKFADPIEIIFGLRAFDSRGVVGGDERQFHVDFTLIAFTIGFFGLFLYLIIYLQLIKDFFLKYKFFRKNKYLNWRYKHHLLTAWVLIFSSLLTSFGGQMYHLSFRIIIFMTLGAIYKLLTIEIDRITNK